MVNNLFCYFSTVLISTLFSENYSISTDSNCISIISSTVIGLEFNLELKSEFGNLTYIAYIWWYKIPTDIKRNHQESVMLIFLQSSQVLERL